MAAIVPGCVRGIARLETLDGSVWFIAPSGLALQNAPGSRKNARKKRQGFEEKGPVKLNKVRAVSFGGFHTVHFTQHGTFVKQLRSGAKQVELRENRANSRDTTLWLRLSTGKRRERGQ
jgi:hypothetical protein